MARSADTYRGARRNACIRQLKQEWGANWYYHAHRNRPEWALQQGLDTANNRPIYIPGMAVRKKWSRISAIYQAAKRGDYRGAAKAFFKKPTSRHATGLGGG